MARSDRYTRKILTSGDRSKWSDLYVSDSNKIILGADGDLQIYHDGNDNHIEATSALNIATANSGVAVKIGHTTSEVSVSDNFTITGNTTANGTVQINNTLTIGVDDTGHDVKFYGATSGRYLLWDESDDALELTDNTKIKLGDGSDFQFYHSGTNSFITNTVGDINIINHTDNGDIKFQGDDQSGGDAVYFRLDGGTGYVKFEDNRRISVGSSNDFMIYHDGTDTKFSNVTGTLQFHQNVNDSDIIFFCDDGSGGTAAYMTIDGGANKTLFYKNTEHQDNVKAEFGDSGDLDIYHDGSNSYIVNATGNLEITNSTNDGDIKFRCDDGSGGNATYLTLDGSDTSVLFSKTLKVVDSAYIGLGDSFDFHLQHNGTDSKITNSTGDLYIINGADDKDIIFQTDDGSGGLETYFAIDGGDHLNVFYKNTWHKDNVKILVGNSNDLQIYHDSNNTYMKQMGTGNLYIQQTTDDADIIFSNDDGSGGVTEYLRLDGGTSRTIFSKNVEFNDNVELLMGGPTGLKIEHNGTHSYFDNSTGDIIFRQYTDDKDIIFQSDDQSGGITTYFTVDGSTGMVKFEDDRRIAIGSGEDTHIYHDGSNSYITHQGTGHLKIRQTTDDSDIIFECDDGSGGTTTYFFLDGSATQTKFNKDTRHIDNIKVLVGSAGDAAFWHDGTRSRLDNYTGSLEITNYADDSDIVFYCDNGSGGTEEYFRLDGSANTAGNPVTLFPDNSLLGFGTGFGDLQLHHDGSDSYIKNRSVGDLIIQQDVDDRDLILKCDNGSGGVTPYITLDGSDLSTRILTQKLIISNLPTSDPGVSGQVWNNNGVLNISAGG